MPDRNTRLIEQWLPINEISVEAIRKGGALAGHPSVNQLHVWWARRPLIASRAAVAASMLPVNSGQGRVHCQPRHYPGGCKGSQSYGRHQG